MAKHIVIERPNGTVTIVRSEIETASEEPLTEHEQIINELYGKVKNLTTPVVRESSFVEELRLKLIGMECFANDYYNDEAKAGTKTVFQELKIWVKEKRELYKQIESEG